MASIRLHGDRWQARVRRKGHPEESRSFATRIDTERWARAIESEIDRGTYTSAMESQRLTLRELIDRYIDEVLPSMKGAEADGIRLRALQRRPICSFSLSALTPTRVAKYRDDRLNEVSAGTVIRELAYLSSVINHARREWGVSVDNPIAKVRKPSTPKGRDRTLRKDEEERRLNALRPLNRRSPWMLPLVVLAIETGVRSPTCRVVGRAANTCRAHQHNFKRQGRGFTRSRSSRAETMAIFSRFQPMPLMNAA